jgi:hypothetical protein
MTLTEMLVAGAILALVAGGSWSAFVGLRKQGNQVLNFSSVLQAASSVEARLELDGAALRLPSGLAKDVKISADGLSMSFLITPRSTSAVSESPGGSPSQRVVWRGEARSEGGWTLVREITSPGFESKMEWQSSPLELLQFSMKGEGVRFFLFAEMFFLSEKSPSSTSTSTSGKRASLPLRWIHRVDTRPIMFGTGEPPAVLASVVPESLDPERHEVFVWNP